MNDQELRIAVNCQLLNAGNRKGLYADALKKFADLIRADEREACVKFLERIDLGNLPPNMALHYELLINSLVSGIRARSGEKK